MVDRLPEFQGPKYAGSFRRGDFADFHQRFSLVPRRCAGKYPPAAREIRADSWAPSIRVARTRKRLPGPPPPRNRSSMLRSAYPPRGDPLDFPIPPPRRLWSWACAQDETRPRACGLGSVTPQLTPRAAQQATRTIPILASTDDVVGRGIMAPWRGQTVTPPG